MKSVLLVVLLAAAATAAVVGNEVPDVVELPDVGLIEMPEMVVTDVDELADAAVLSYVAKETAVASRRNLSQGSIGSSDVLVSNTEHRANGVAGHVHMRELTIRTNRQITAIRVTYIGDSQNATPFIVSGGIGNSFVTIRIQSDTGCGFYYSIQIYGR